MTAARDRRPRGLTEAIWEQTAELGRLRTSHAALLAACEMMLVDMGTERGFDAAILTMRAAVKQAREGT